MVVLWGSLPQPALQGSWLRRPSELSKCEVQGSSSSSSSLRAGAAAAAAEETLPKLPLVLTQRSDGSSSGVQSSTSLKFEEEELPGCGHFSTGFKGGAVDSTGGGLAADISTKRQTGFRRQNSSDQAALANSPSSSARPLSFPDADVGESWQGRRSLVAGACAVLPLCLGAGQPWSLAQAADVQRVR